MDTSDSQERYPANPTESLHCEPCMIDVNGTPDGSPVVLNVNTDGVSGAEREVEGGIDDGPMSVADGIAPLDDWAVGSTEDGADDIEV
jgi:hypothetical protein